MKCESVKCEAVAVYYVAWPGQSSCMCEHCAARARLVAAYMSFTLAVLPLTAELAGAAAGDAGAAAVK